MLLQLHSITEIEQDTMLDKNKIQCWRKYLCVDYTWQVTKTKNINQSLNVCEALEDLLGWPSWCTFLVWNHGLLSMWEAIAEFQNTISRISWNLS